jgi:hypothetical protein
MHTPALRLHGRGSARRGILIYKRPRVIIDWLADMKKAVAFANIASLVFPMAVGFFGTGCVNLDKPSAVAACASGKTGPCLDGDKKDAAGARDDVASSEALPGADRPSDTADLPRADGAGAGADAAGVDRADAGLPGVDAEPDTSSTAVDASPADTRPAALDTTGPVDVAATEVPRTPIDGQPGSADVADLHPADASDAGPDSGPDVGLDTPPDLPAPDGPPPTTTTITFKSGRASATGVNGFGWVSLGSADTVTSPVCGATATPITATAPCISDSVWDSTTALCVTGTVPALSATDPDYTANWGVQVGTNLREPLGPGGLTFKSVAVNITGTPLSGLRLELHRSGDASGTTYCALVTSGTAIALTKFNTQCWNDLGDAFPDADGAKVDKISIQVSSGAADIPINRLCLSSIVLGT